MEKEGLEKHMLIFALCGDFKWNSSFGETIILMQLRIVLLRNSFQPLEGATDLRMEMEQNQAGLVAPICDRGGGEGMVLYWFGFFLAFN